MRNAGGRGLAVPVSPEVVVREPIGSGAVALIRTQPANPSVALAGYLRAGAMLDPVGREGLALLTSSMLTRGTASHSSQSLAETLDSIGASLNVRADMEGTVISAQCLAEDVGQVLELTSEVVMQPTFPPEEIEKQRGRIITGIREGRLDTRVAADKAFRAAAYPPEHPHHRTPEGEEESVSAITRDDLVTFHRRHFRPEGFVIAVVGDVVPEQVLGHLRALWDGWRPLGAVQTSMPPEAGPASSMQRRVVSIPGKTQADIVLGAPGFTRTSPDFYPGMVADLILGRLGLMGRLGATVRDEEGLAYYVYSQAQAGFLAGPWAVRAGVNPRNVDRAIEGILREIRGLQREPVRDGELADAQNYLTGSLAVRLETNGGIAQALLEIELFNLGLDYLLRYPDLIHRVTPQAIGEVASRYLDLNRHTIAIAAPA
jgi:zinc protease